MDNTSLPEEIKGRVMQHYNSFMKGCYSTSFVPTLEVVQSPTIMEEVVVGISKCFQDSPPPAPPRTTSEKEGLQAKVDTLLKGFEVMWNHTQQIFKTVATLYNEITTIKQNQEMMTEMFEKNQGWR